MLISSSLSHPKPVRFPFLFKTPDEVVANNVFIE